MGTEKFKKLGMSALGILLAALLLVAGFGTTKVLAAEETPNMTQEQLAELANELIDSCSFTQIIKAAATSKKNADLGTIERAVTGETISLEKKTSDDGSIAVKAHYSDKNGAQTGVMLLVFVPYEKGYHLDVTYFHYDGDKIDLIEYIRSNVSKNFEGIHVEDEFVKAASLTGKEVTVYDAFNDLHLKYVSEKTKQGNSVIEDVTAYLISPDGKEVKFESSKCYTTSYEVIEGQKFSKSYCTYYNMKDEPVATYICLEDTYIENGVINRTRCFAWDGSPIYGSGDGNYEAFAFKFVYVDRVIDLVGSTCDCSFSYADPEKGEILLERLSGIFHPAKKGEPAKVFCYDLSGEYYETILGGFAKFRTDLPYGALKNSDLLNRLVDVAARNAEDPLIYCANIMAIIPGDDGSTSVAYNSYDNSEADATVNHQYAFEYDAEGNKKTLTDEQADVNITIPQEIIITKKYEVSADKLAKADANFNLTVLSIGKAKCKKVSGDENITIAKNGKVTIAKGAYEPGTVLSFKVKVKAAAGLHALKNKKKANIKVTIG